MYLRYLGNKIIGRIGGQGTESECGELYQILSLGVNFQITLRMIHVRFRAESKVDSRTSLRVLSTIGLEGKFEEVY